MRNQSGIITLDFMVALVIGFGMSAILFAMTFTLSVVEIAQYMTFSSARAQAAGHKDPLEQEQAARLKFSKLLNNGVLAPLFSNGWFEISKAEELEVRGGETGTSSQGSFRNDYPSAGSENRRIFAGVRATLSAKMLEMRLPLIGNTADGEEGGFSTKITTILIREPSQVECQKFIKDRYSKLMSLDGRFSSYGSHQADYAPMEDNGC